MTQHSTKTTRWQRTPGVSFEDAPPQVDAESGILRDVVLAQVGEAKGHKRHLDQDFINELVRQGEEVYSRRGLKSRFGHPSMSADTMGTQLGVYYNFRVRGEQAIADLYLLDASAHSPKGNLREWTLKMAAERPDFIMNSIVFQPGEDYYYNDEGEKVYFRDWEGEHKYEKAPPDGKDVFVTLKTLHFSDLVEQGAATDSLFSVEFNREKFAVAAHEFLNEREDIDAFIRANPEKLVKFLSERGISLQKTSWFEKLTDLFTPSAKLESLTANVEALTQQLDTLQAQYNAEVEAHGNTRETLQDTQKLLDANASALSVAQARVEELEAMPVTVTASAFPHVSSAPRALKPWEQIEQEMAERRAKIQNLGRK